MKTKYKIAVMAVVALIIALLTIALTMTWSELRASRAETAKQKSNVETLRKGQEDYIIRDSIRVSTIEALEFDKKQFKDLCADQQKEIELLKQKKGKIEYYTNVTKTDSFYVTSWDTIYREKDTCIMHHDPFLDVYSCADTMVFEVRDTLRQAIYKCYKHKFLWWQWGNGGYRQHLWSSNPHASYKFDEFIKVE